jgi:deoxyribodipyrimidine photo-lyase
MSKPAPRRGATPKARPGLLWLRQDLRLEDNPSLHALADGPLLAVFVLPEDPVLRPGAASRWWLHHSLKALGEALAAQGVTLLLMAGDATRLIPELAARIDAAAVHAGRVYDPAGRRQDATVSAALEADGRALVLHTASLLLEPHRLRSGAGKPYAVYTPFARAILALGDPPPPIPAPAALTGCPAPEGGLTLEALRLLPQPPEPDWAAEFPAFWQPGEAGAHSRLRDFLEEGVAEYGQARNRPGEDGSSRLSPHLRHGEISPRQVWHALRDSGRGGAGAETYLKEILWREFSYHLLWHRPELPDKPLRAEFAAFPWQPDAALLRAWQRGLTGYPIVDAGMRQLWRLGWMHNRVRMVAASLLVKHLLQPWQDGTAWFLDTLVDADPASNSASWQWVAGCGTDSAPYFRIFNPVLQGEKFDPDGAYLAEFVPELSALPAKWRHKPWLAPAAVLDKAGVVLGTTYPHPLVDHGAARARALQAFAQVMAARAA